MACHLDAHGRLTEGLHNRLVQRRRVNDQRDLPEKPA